MENWVSVFTTTSELEAGIVKDLLDEAGIPAVILNQKDSSYQTFGDISVMVSRDDQEEAKKVIKDYYEEREGDRRRGRDNGRSTRGTRPCR